MLTASPWVLGLDTRTWQSLWKIGPLRDQAGSGDIPGKKVLLDTRRDRVIVATAALQAGAIQTWSLSSGRRLSSFVPYATGVSLLIVSPVSGNVFTGGDGLVKGANPSDLSSRTWVEDDPDMLVRAWEPQTGKMIATYAGAGQAVRGLALSPNDRYLIASKARSISPPPHARDAHVLAWEKATGRMLVATNLGQGFSGAIAFSPDGRRLAIEINQVLQIIELDSRVFP